MCASGWWLRQQVGFFSRKKKSNDPIISPKPAHVAVIMDGNGRWAKAQGLTRIAGHKKGVDSVKSAIKSCLEHDIAYLSIFAFSSENWKRPEGEVNALMDLLANALETQTKKINENGIRLNLIGDLSKFSPRIQKLAKRAREQTSHNDKLILSVAINYGGRWDIVESCKQIASKVEQGTMSISDIDEQSFEQHLSTYGMPDPDLVIRTSGEYRISNFLLWQVAYAEFYFTDVLWPDFGSTEFVQALLQYKSRDRRFGKVKRSIESMKSA